MPCASFVVQSSTVNTPCKNCIIKWYCEVLCRHFVVQGSIAMFQMCQKRISNKSVLQECFRLLRESVVSECATRVSSKSVRQECLTRVPHKSVPQECPTRAGHKSVMQECPTRFVREDYQARAFCKSCF